MRVVHKFTSLVVSLSLEVTGPCLGDASVSLPFCACVSLRVEAPSDQTRWLQSPRHLHKDAGKLNPSPLKDAVMLRVLGPSLLNALGKKHRRLLLLSLSDDRLDTKLLQTHTDIK